MRIAAIVLLLGSAGAACAASSWIDPHATARSASKLYDEGKFGDAAAKYREALVDDPDSALLHYNAGLASYRDGKYDDALAALGAVAAADSDPARTARAAYAAGNAKYRLGAAAEASKPQDALKLYAEALMAYRRAMGADPADEDAKFNHEFVERKIADLKKKLEEQKKDQEQKQDQKQDQQQQQQQQDQQQQQQQQNRQQQDEQKDQQQADDQQKQDDQQQQQQDQKKDQQPQEQQQQQQQQAGQQQDQGDQGQEQEKEQQQRQQAQAGDQGDEKADRQQADAGEDDVAGEPTDEMSQREAQALLDGQRDQEVRPDEIIKRLDRGRVAEPRQDW